MKYASFNNCHNNGRSNEQNTSIITHVQVNRSIFASYGTHALKYFASLIFVSGTQDAEVTKSLGQWKIFSNSWPPRPSVAILVVFGLVNLVKFLSRFKCVLNKKYIYLKCLRSFFRWDKKIALIYIQFCRQFSAAIEHELTRVVNKWEFSLISFISPGQ